MMSEKRFVIKSTATELELYDDDVQIGEFPHFEWVAKSVDSVVDLLNEQSEEITRLEEENKSLKTLLNSSKIREDAIRDSLSQSQKEWNEMYDERSDLKVENEELKKENRELKDKVKIYEAYLGSITLNSNSNGFPEVSLLELLNGSEEDFQEYLRKK